MNLCVYDTVKHVQVRDARLAVLRYFFLLTIGIYVCVFELWAFGGWLDSSPVVGVVRFSLQQPTLDNCNPALPNCTNAFHPLDKLPYCSQFHGKNHVLKNHTEEEYDVYPGNVFKCEIYEAINAQIMSEKSLVVITRGSTTEQSLVCTDDMMTCPRTYQTSAGAEEHKFYTADVESFTILLDHAVTASKLCTHQQQGYTCSSESSKYQGRLFSKSSELCIQHKEHAFAHYRGSEHSNTTPCYIQPNQTSNTGQDFFSLDVLLKAAGIHLDDCNNNFNDAMEEGMAQQQKDQFPSCQTFRETGATILLNVYWNDFVPYVGKVEPYYYYSPQFIAGSSFKQFIPFYHQYRDSRTLLNAHGVKLAVLVAGEFNHFNVIKFLTTVTTALGLLAVANTIVDNLMLYVLPEKELYTRAKYETTEDLFHPGAEVTGITGSSGQQEQHDTAAHGDHGDVGHEPAPAIVAEESNEQNELREPLL